MGLKIPFTGIFERRKFQRRTNRQRMAWMGMWLSGRAFALDIQGPPEFNP
jgi:hypothetical protein